MSDQPKTKSKWSRWLFGLVLLLSLVSLGCVVASLFYKAIGSTTFDIDVGRYTILPGMQVLTLGWMGFLVGCLGWFANPVYIVTQIMTWIALFRRPDFAVISFIFSVITTVLGLWSYELLWVAPTDFFIGFYVWMAGLLLMNVASMIVTLKCYEYCETKEILRRLIG